MKAIYKHAAWLTYLCVASPPPPSHKIQLYQQINTGIDGPQIKTIMATSSKSSAELISF